MAVQLLDDLSARAILDADVRIRGLEQSPVVKQEGFYVFTDLPDGSHHVDIESRRHRRFEHAVALPLPPADRLVLNVPGENELILAVQTVNPADNSITFQARDIVEPLPAGTPVISSKLVTALVATLEGEAVDTATLADTGSGASALAADDVIRLVKQRVVRMRPGPYYDFDPGIRRIAGSVRELATGRPIVGASVELVRINGTDIASEAVGLTAADTAQVHTLGSGLAKRVVGTAGDARATSNDRGRYGFHFPARLDLVADAISLRVTATGYAPQGPVAVDLTARPDNEFGFEMAAA